MHHLIHFRFSLLPRTVVVLSLLALFGLAPVQSTYAATIIVNNTADNLTASDGFCTLREAISNANSDSDTTGGDCVAGSGADIITLPSGTYTLSLAGRLENANATGDLDITSSLTINGGGARTTIIDANDIDRVLDVQASTTVVINDVTIQNGNANQTGGDGSPGTSGEDGGGIRANGGSISLTINDSRLTSNNAYDDGGGLSTNTSTTTATINRSLFDNNSAVGSSNDNGGALNAWPGGNIIVNNTTISNNTSGNGGAGAIFSQGGVVTVNHTTITGNSDLNGGAAALSLCCGGVITIENSIVAGNSTVACDAGVTSNGYNIVGLNGSANGCPSGGTGDQILAGAIGTLLNTTLANNGGSTDTHALVSGGVAVNQIPNGTNGCGTTYTTDQRGVTRPQNSTCDAGAYELVTAVSPGVGGDGPGGVNATNGTTTLELWLRADRGTFSNSGCTVTATGGGTVGCWGDQSGNNANASHATSSFHPTYALNNLNGLPVLQFAADKLNILNFSALTGVANYSVYVVGEHTGVSVLIGGTQTGTPLNHGMLLGAFYEADDVRFLHRMPFGAGGGDNLITTTNNYTINTPHILSGIRNSSGSTQGFWLDGNNQGSIATASAAFSLNLDLAIGDSTANASQRPLTGEIAEVILFSEASNSVRQLLIENYLSAKYNLLIPGANDHYDGDTAGNGDFDLDVAGIGRFGSNNHTQSHAAGMIVVNSSFLQDNGDWLLFGHRTATNGDSTADLPTTGDWATAPAPQRWERHFYIDVTDAVGTTGGTVDIIFDYSEGGMDGNPASLPGGPISNYRLLRRSGTSGQFSDIATATAIVGDQVHFQGVDVSLLGSNFTLGSLDDGASPTAVSLQTISSNTGVIPTFIVGLLLLTLVGTSLLVLRRKQTM